MKLNALLNAGPCGVSIRRVVKKKTCAYFSAASSCYKDKQSLPTIWELKTSDPKNPRASNLRSQRTRTSFQFPSSLVTGPRDHCDTDTRLLGARARVFQSRLLLCMLRALANLYSMSSSCVRPAGKGLCASVPSSTRSIICCSGASSSDETSITVAAMDRRDLLSQGI